MQSFPATTRQRVVVAGLGSDKSLDDSGTGAFNGRSFPTVGVC